MKRTILNDEIIAAQESEPLTVAQNDDPGSTIGLTWQPLKLLFVANVAGDRLTGAGNVFLSLSDALERRGHQVDVLFKEDLPSAEKTGRMSRLVFPYLAAREIRARIRRGRAYDAVMIHEPSGMAYALARKWDSSLPPLVAMSQGIEQRAWELNAERTPRSLKTRVLYPITELWQANYALRHADAVACVAGEDAEYVSNRLGALRAQVHCLSNGVDGEFLKREWVSSEEPGLLFVGTWILRKGSHEVIGLFEALKKSFPWLRLAILGSGVPADFVRSNFPSGLQNSVTVLPRVPREEMPGLLARDQVFVLPSYFEGMPLSLLEAMASGLPCVTTNVCGMHDLISNSDNGFLVGPGDVAGLTASVSSLLRSAALRRRIGDAARETARNLVWDKVALEWEKVFSGLVSLAAGPGIAQEYDHWHESVSCRDDLEKDLENPWHRFVRQQVHDVRQKRVLEAACGRGQLILWLRQQGAEAVGVDFSPVALGLARQRMMQAHDEAALTCADVLSLPFASGSFDCVVSCETLEHVPNPPACLGEFRRVLQRGGKLILTTENYLNIWGLYRLYIRARRRKFNSGDRVQPIEQWMFSPRTLRMVRQSGFRVLHTDGEGHHLLLLPGVNPPDLEARALSRIPWVRRALHRFARHFFLVAEAI
jgi:glycosyltransferase involved in cell wall biosynthesis/ubiquinone/menaquinone biosynthesis C-methylase UbiE